MFLFLLCMIPFRSYARHVHFSSPGACPDQSKFKSNQAFAPVLRRPVCDQGVFMPLVGPIFSTTKSGPRRFPRPRVPECSSIPAASCQDHLGSALILGWVISSKDTMKVTIRISGRRCGRAEARTEPARASGPEEVHRAITPGFFTHTR